MDRVYCYCRSPLIPSKAPKMYQVSIERVKLTSIKTDQTVNSTYKSYSQGSIFSTAPLASSVNI